MITYEVTMTTLTGDFTLWIRAMNLHHAESQARAQHPFANIFSIKQID